ncbi:MAG: succinylglutamate desuccinylase [Geminicoccaceae bacterium]|nr:MAG: succinylglutamate desuccinylase [Geminicoccaceae bacterium]
MSEYPVELAAPDIEPYRAGNTGIPWITTFAADAPGPHVAVTALVHGNELCGPLALDFLFHQGVRPRRGRLSLAFLNIEAYRRFDPANPAASRWAEEDFNRIWDTATLEGPRDSLELRRAREVRPWVDTVDLLLDIHSMQHATAPLTLAGLHAKGAALAEATGVPSVIVADAGHAAGRRLRDYGDFGRADGEKAAILVECGQHWARRTADVAIESTVRFLRATGTVEPDFAADVVPTTLPPPPTLIDVTTAVTIRHADFRFTQPFQGMEIIERAGTIIAHDGPDAVRTPYDGCVLIMPTRRLQPGQTAVRLGRIRATG